MRKPGTYYITHRKGSKRDARTVATFTSSQLRKMYEYINHMNGLGIGMFYFRTVPTIDWDEEELLHTLMQPIDEVTTASLFALERESNPTTQGAAQLRSLGEGVGKEFSFR